jgi:hypothetical protein
MRGRWAAPAVAPAYEEEVWAEGHFD